MELGQSWAEISQASLMESDDEDIFASIDLSETAIDPDPYPRLIHLDCNRDCSDYNEWAQEKCFTNVFDVDECCFFDPELLNTQLRICRQNILEMKMLGQDQLQKRLTVTNFLHFVYNEIGNGSAAQDLQLIRSLLDDNKFLPTVQDGKHYVHGYFEWKLLLILIAEKSDGCANILKDLCVQLMGYSICIVGDSDLRQNTPFPCNCFQSMWSIILAITQNITTDLNIWTLLDVSLHSVDNNSLNLQQSNNKGKNYSSLIQIWFLRHFPKCIKETTTNANILSEYTEVISRSFTTFLEKEPSEAELRMFLHELRIVVTTHQVNVDTLIQLWEYLYIRINTNFKTINLDSTNSMLVPNDTSLSYVNKIRHMVVNFDEDNSPNPSNLTSYDLFLEMLIRSWQRANQEADPKYQQKLSNRVLLKFSSKMWLPLNEIGIHNLINLLLVMYYLGDDRTLDRIENVLLSVPFADITHNRRVAVFKGLTALLIMFYGKPAERKSKSYPDSFIRKFENVIGVDRFTGRQMICAIDTIFSASERLANKEYLLINPWIKVYLNSCTDNDREVLLDTLTRIMEKFIRLRREDLIVEDAEEVIKRIYLATDGVILGYLNAEREVDVSNFTANLMLSLKQPIKDLPLVDNMFTNLILNNLRNPRQQLMIVNKLAELEKGSVQPTVHVNNLIKAMIKFLMVIDGPAVDLQPIFSLVKDTKEFRSFCMMDSEDFFESPQPFTVFLKGIRTSFESGATDADRDRFLKRFEMYFQMYTKWCLPHMKTAEEALRCYSNTTAMIYVCAKLMYPTRNTPNMLKSIICDFYLTSALLGRKAQPPVVVKAMLQVMHLLLGALFQLESGSANDQYLSTVISNLILHWIPQFSTEFNVSTAVAPLLKFTKANISSHRPQVLFERMCQVLLTNQLQRDVLAIKLLREIFTQNKDEMRVIKVLLNGCLLGVLEYYCKIEDSATVKTGILGFLEEISTANFLMENGEISSVIDEAIEKWTLSTLHLPNYFELAVKLARLFPVSLRMIMPKVRAKVMEHSKQVGMNVAAADRMNQKLRNLEMILHQ